MSRVCGRCGKLIDVQDVAFCPYCGTKMETDQKREARNEEAEKWIQKALAVTSYPARKKILQEGLEACPDSREIAWELLFIGEEGPKKGKVIDYSVIKCWILEIYRQPGDFTDEKKDRMREQLFDAPELKRCLERFEHPEEKKREYLQRLCTEYVELFLEGSNQVIGRIFGFQLGWNKEKKLAVPVAQMTGRIREDEKLSPEQREQLCKALYQAYAVRTGGKTGPLDELLNS